jgi:hypothetical protein
MTRLRFRHLPLQRRLTSLRYFACGIALLLPGSFLVLPLLWAWRRWATRLPAGVRAHGPGSQRA